MSKLTNIYRQIQHTLMNTSAKLPKEKRFHLADCDSAFHGVSSDDETIHGYHQQAIDGHEQRSARENEKKEIIRKRNSQ